MRTWLVIAAVVLISMTARAQMPLPGTFTSVPAQQVQAGTPILAPPTATLGNGLSPTVITTKQAFVVSAPQNVALEPSVMTTGVAPATTTAEQQQPQVQQASATGAVPAKKYFDFVVSSSAGSSSATGDSENLAELARSTRKSNFRPASGKAFTNDDIARMNQMRGTRTVPSTPANPGPGSANTDGGTSGTAIGAGQAQQQPGTTQTAPATASPTPR